MYNWFNMPCRCFQLKADFPNFMYLPAESKRSIAWHTMNNHKHSRMIKTLFLLWCWAFKVLQVPDILYKSITSYNMRQNKHKNCMRETALFENAAWAPWPSTAECLDLSSRRVGGGANISFQKGSDLGYAHPSSFLSHHNQGKSVSPSKLSMCCMNSRLMPRHNYRLSC